MNRREFGATLAGGALGAALPGLRGVFRQTPILRVNAARINAHLAAWMTEAHLVPSIDFAGNLIGRRAGTDATRKPILFGSHVDPVPEGGNFDGQVGTTAAIEAAQTLAESGRTLRHPIEVVVWTNEEGGLYGSRTVSG